MKESTLEIIKTINNSGLNDLSFMAGITRKDIQNYKEKSIQLGLDNEHLAADIEELGEVKKLLIRLKNSKMTDKKDFILTTINTALNDVFLDQNVKIDLVASNTNKDASKLNIKYDIVLYQNSLEMARNEKLLSKNGGGVLSFISILFKILVGYIYSKNKFYIFDESLAEVSEMYRPRMAQFIQKFCEKHNFNIIIITQTSDIAEYADIVYRLDGEFKDGIPTLKIDKIEGDYPEEDYIYTKIKNFQSIVDLEFRYKGFTAIIGKNNIGKSASFRAVNSIIFNNFDMKEFPRMKSAEQPEKLLASRIEFGKIAKKDDPANENTKITMYKKGQSLIYEFNGDTFVGKNLAFEKVKEKVEEIGFRYLNLKEQYKNFKGSLKDQTERLAITTQQDTYYLIGGKTSETSKVFDFLFDSREVTMAINNLNEDVLSYEQTLNTNTQEISQLDNLIKFSELKLRLLDSRYKILLIDSLIEQSHLLDDLHKEEYHTKNLFENIKKTIDVINILNSLNYYEKNIRDIDINQTKNENKINILNKLIDVLNKKVVCALILNYDKDIKKFDIQIKLKNTEYKQLLVRIIFNVSNLLKDIDLSIRRSTIRINLLDRLINTIQKQQFIEYFMIQYENKEILVNKTRKVNNKINLVYALIENLNKKQSVLNFIWNIQEQYTYLNGLNKEEKIIHISINLLDNKIKQNKIYEFQTNISQIQKHINDLGNQYQQLSYRIENLPNEYGLEPCTGCGGLGFHIH